MHDPERDIRDIPLSQLELSPDNVRKTPADASAFTELKASIAAHGLLENLIARAMEPGPDGPTRYAVIAGGRRLAAMQALAAEGALGEDHPVPCRMIGAIVAAEEVSLAENSVRAAMHPADQVEAFRRLADAGSTAAAIAARFGVSERTVEKRLRLGNAAPVLLEAYRAGEIDLETLMAFAVTTDQARQSAVWETVGQQGYRPGAWQIKRLLTEDRVSATSAIARFVGIEAYEAAGGRIDRDLFAEEDERGIWFDDPDLLNKLAIDSLQVAARELETRWKWAEARLDVDWSATAAFGRVRPQPAEPTDGEKAEIERLRTRNDELANMDDEDWTEELVEEADANETPARRDRGHDRGPRGLPARGYRHRRVHRHCRQRRRTQTDPGPGQARGHARARSRRSGRGRTRRYRGRGEHHLRHRCANGRGSPRFSRRCGGRGAQGSGRRHRPRRRLCGPSARPSSRASSPATSRRPSICCCSSSPGACSPAATMTTRSTSGQPRPRTVRPCGSTTMLSATINVGEKHLEIDRAAQKLDWTGLSDTEAFAELRALPERDKRTLFASCVARTLKGQLAFEPKARPEVEATVARLGIDFAAAVRGNRDQVWTADLLWSRLRKDRILAIARETLGETWAQAEAKQKKAEIAKAMQDAFAHGDGVPAGITAEGRAAAIAWTPPGFRAFDTGADDDSALADDEGTTAPEPQPSKIDMPSVDALEHNSDDPSGADGEARQDDATEPGSGPACAGSGPERDASSRVPMYCQASSPMPQSPLKMSCGISSSPDAMARIARTSSALAARSIQARALSTVASRGEPPRRSQLTKDGLPLTSRPNSEGLAPVTARKASTSRRKPGPMGSSPMKASSRSAVSRRGERPRRKTVTKDGSPNAASPKRVRLMPRCWMKASMACRSDVRKPAMTGNVCGTSGLDNMF